MADYRRAGRSGSGPSPGSGDKTPAARSLTFSAGNDFQARLRSRVDAYFRDSGRSRRDSTHMYVKAAVIFTTFAVAYGLLVFAADAWWQALPLAVLLGLATVGIGFNLMHDGGHGAFSKHGGINQLMARSLDLVGGSSYLWHWKHRIIHHTYANITGHDTDIAIGKLARFTPHQPRHSYHRWQHWYIWLLYGVMVPKWHFHDDFRTLLIGRIGPHDIPRPRGRDLAALIACKAAFFVLAFGVPLLFHPLWAVVLCYCAAAIVAGVALSVVFQLAHCVEEAAFPVPAADMGSMSDSWAVHQVRTTVNFSRRNRAITWLLGGLNFQIEHHLFPRVCHSHYPAIAVLVKETCRDFAIRYNEHESFWSGMRSHFRWLRRMGAPA